MNVTVKLTKSLTRDDITAVPEVASLLMMSSPCTDLSLFATILSEGMKNAKIDGTDGVACKTLAKNNLRSTDVISLYNFFVEN